MADAVLGELLRGRDEDLAGDTRAGDVLGFRVRVRV